jgi:hypothetical protein
VIVARGIHRIRDGFVTQHSVLVDYGESTHEIPEDLYRRHGYQPPFEQLPWQDEDEGDAAQPATRQVRRRTDRIRWQVPQRRLLDSQSSLSSLFEGSLPRPKSDVFDFDHSMEVRNRVNPISDASGEREVGSRASRTIPSAPHVARAPRARHDPAKAIDPFNRPRSVR